MEASWADLLQKAGSSKRQRGGEGLGRGARLESSPKSRPLRDRVGSKRNIRATGPGSLQVQVEALRWQVARLVREKKELEGRGKEFLQSAEERERQPAKTEQVAEARHEPTAVREMSHESWQRQTFVRSLINDRDRLARRVDFSESPAKIVLNHSKGLNGPLTSNSLVEIQSLHDALDNTTRERDEIGVELEREKRRRRELEERLREKESANAQLEESLSSRSAEVEGLLAHLQDLRGEVTLLSQSMPSEGHSVSSFKNMERLSLRNAELSEALSSTQYSRTTLEKDVLSLKRSLLQVQSQRGRLEESLAAMTHERDSARRQLEACKAESHHQLGELQRDVDAAVSAKSERVRELLGVSDQLQGTLHTLAKEKDLLATSLREEASYTHKLEEEKCDLESRLCSAEKELSSTREELEALKQTQVSEINAKCREVDAMKGQLQRDMVALQRDRDSLVAQLTVAMEEREKTRADEASLTSKLSSTCLRLSAAEKEKEDLEKQIRELKEAVGVWRERSERSERERKEVEKLSEARTKLQVESLSSQVAHSQQLGSQLQVENAALLQRVERLTRQLAQTEENRETEVARQQESLHQAISDLDAAVSELETTRTTNMLLQQQVADLESQVSGYREQLNSRGELTNEMKALLDQRGVRIRQLEKTVQSQRQEISHASDLSRSMEALHNVSSSSSLLLLSPSRSRVSSPPPPHTPPSRFSSPSTELVHLKQRLSESRQNCVRLEMQQASLKTELAKLQGSAQALGTIKDQLSSENHTLQRKMQRIEEEKGAVESERETLRKEVAREREGRREVESELQQLVREREEMEQTQREMEAHIGELEEAHILRERETATIDNLYRDCNKQLEASRAELHSLHSELSLTRGQLSGMREELESAGRKMTREAGHLKEEAGNCSSELAAMKAEAVEVEETSRITGAVNTTRLGQIQGCEASISQLMAEVEVLRARKLVVSSYLRARGEGDEGMERNRLKEALDHVRGELASAVKKCDGLEREVGRLREEAEERKRRGKEEEEAVLVQERGKTKQAGSSLAPAPHEEVDTGSCRSVRQQKLSRLRLRLRTQVRQTNHLRLKLGYTLSELRLHKRLKTELDQRLASLQDGLTSSQQQYQQCLQRLQLAERLGFGGCS